MLEAGIARAWDVTREDALKKVVRQPVEGRQHRLMVTYHWCSSPALGPILQGNYKAMVRQDQRMGRTFPRLLGLSTGWGRT